MTEVTEDVSNAAFGRLDGRELESQSESSVDETTSEHSNILMEDCTDEEALNVAIKILSRLALRNDPGAAFGTDVGQQKRFVILTASLLTTMCGGTLNKAWELVETLQRRERGEYARLNVGTYGPDISVTTTTSDDDDDDSSTLGTAKITVEHKNATQYDRHVGLSLNWKVSGKIHLPAKSEPWTENVERKVMRDALRRQDTLVFGTRNGRGEVALRYELFGPFFALYVAHVVVRANRQHAVNLGSTLCKHPGGCKHVHRLRKLVAWSHRFRRRWTDVILANEPNRVLPRECDLSAAEWTIVIAKCIGLACDDYSLGGASEETLKALNDEWLANYVC